MPPHSEEEKDEIKGIIKQVAESTAKITAETVKKDIIEEMGSKGSKISEMLKGTKPQISDEEKEKLEREKKAKHEDAVFCPNCSKGDKEHSHALKEAGPGKVKCTGDSCGIVYNLIPDNAGYKCTSCGVPHGKPTVITQDDKCPFCGNESFEQFDWSKVKNKKKK